MNGDAPRPVRWLAGKLADWIGRRLEDSLYRDGPTRQTGRDHHRPERGDQHEESNA